MLLNFIVDLLYLINCIDSISNEWASTPHRRNVRLLRLTIHSFIHSFIMNQATWPIDSSNTIKWETD